MILTKISGDLGADLQRFADRIGEEVLKAGAGAMSAVIREEVGQNAERHRKTGALASAVYQVYAEEDSGKTRQVYRVGINRSKAPHWHLLEHGTSRAPAYPIVRPALDAMPRAIEAGRERMGDKLRET